jgi:hypothetical protein
MGIFDKKLPEERMIKGKQLKCHHCGNELFFKKEPLFGDYINTVFGGNITGTTAACYICSECTCVHWFTKPETT